MGTIMWISSFMGFTTLETSLYVYHLPSTGIGVPAFAWTDEEFTVHMEANYTSAVLEKQGLGVKSCS